MDHAVLLFVSPPACALLGWLVARLGLALLFRPREPVRLGPFTLHGLLPANRERLAHDLADLAADGFESRADPSALARDQALLASLSEMIHGAVDRLVREKLPTAHPLVAKALGEQGAARLAESLSARLDQLAPRLLERAAEGLNGRVDLPGLVREKVRALALQELEPQLADLLRPARSRVALAGAVIGLLAGLAQSLAFYLVLPF